MKIPATVKTSLFFIAGLLLGTALFAPLDAIAEYASAIIRESAISHNIELEINESSSDGIFNPKFLFSGIKVTTSLATIRMAYVEADPFIIKSIGKNKYTSIKTGGGIIHAGTGDMLTWRSAQADVTIKENSIFINNIYMDGDIKARGSIEISLNGKLINSDLYITLPKKFDPLFKTIAIIGSLPLKKGASGEWRLSK